MISAPIDSNTYISALQFGGVGSRIIWMARAGKLRIDTTDAILNEMVGVLRDKFNWEGYRLHFARLELLEIANRVEPKLTLNIVDDPDDNRILECAAEAGSDYILTRDNDLLRLKEYHCVQIITPDAFLRQ